MLSHAGEEGGVIVKGKIELSGGGDSRVLAAGDAYYFKSSIPHRFRNPGREECELVSASSPPRFERLPEEAGLNEHRNGSGHPNGMQLGSRRQHGARRELIREAAGRGANVVLIQELFETPYFCKDHSPQHFELARPLEGHPAVEHFRKLARELSVVLPVSVVRTCE